jgi:hypothetical protein
VKSRGEALRDYVVWRLLLMIPTFIGITLVTFLLCQFVPGGPIDQLRLQMAGRAGEAGAGGSHTVVQLSIPEDQLAVLKSYYGFDKPVIPRYLGWLGKVLRLDLGDSFRFSEPVLRIIADRLPVSMYYGIMTAMLKGFIDKLLPLATPYIRKNDDGYFYHEGRERKLPSIIIMANSGFPGQHNFDLLDAVFNIFNPIAKIYRNCGEMLKSAPGIAGSIDRYLACLKTAGLEIVCNGFIEANTMEELNKPIISDEEYMMYVNRHWDEKLCG